MVELGTSSKWIRVILARTISKLPAVVVAAVFRQRGIFPFVISSTESSFWLECIMMTTEKQKQQEWNMNEQCIGEDVVETSSCPSFIGASQTRSTQEILSCSSFAYEQGYGWPQLVEVLEWFDLDHPTQQGTTTLLREQCNICSLFLTAILIFHTNENFADVAKE